MTRGEVGGSIRAARQCRNNSARTRSGIPLRAGDVGGQPVGEFVRVGDRALPEPQVIADLAAVVFDGAAGPLVEADVRRRDLDLPRDEADGLVRELRPARGEPPMLGEELQQDRKAQARRPALPGDQLPLVIQHRPALDELVQPKRHTIHSHMVT